MPKVSFADQEAPAVQEGIQEGMGGISPEIQSGLEQILASQDINEVHAIAQGLLGMSAAPQGESLEAGLDQILNKG